MKSLGLGAVLCLVTWPCWLFGPFATVYAQAAPSAGQVVPTAIDADAGVDESGSDLEMPASPPMAAPTPVSTATSPAESVAVSELPDYGAVAVAPAPGALVALDKLPSNVQLLNLRTLQEQHALSLHDVLNARLGSITINDVQSNPLQPDLQYRGFSASPLLGTPQGMSVYQNGVRLNEPFGDVLQWDLIPLFALSEVQLWPGENPVYGLNTLGGSLVLRMKDGFSAPGYRIEGSAGSFSRYRTTAEYGNSDGKWAGYAGASLLGEEGFRDKSHTAAQSLYTDLRRRGDDYELGVGLTLAHTDLNGNGPTPIELLRNNRSAIYTWPDNTQNDLVMLSLDGQERLADTLTLEGTAYLRHTERATSNGDQTDVAPCAAPGGDPSVLCADDGAALQTSTRMSVPSNAAYDAVFNTTHTISNGFGASIQLSLKQPLLARANQLVVGASYDGSQTAFTQRTELGRLTIDRGVEGGGPSLAGAGLQTDLNANNHMVGAYVVDTWNPINSLAIHVSGRMNWFITKLSDRLGSALDGQHLFARFDPAIGFSQRLLPQLTLFAGYGETNRAPSAAELACADPNQPCRLPNAFISDPPLKQVVSRSAEIGLRTRFGPAQHPSLQGSLAAFGARNHNDILFIAGSRVGTGYFQNAGETQRIGIEASLAGDMGPLSWYASYSLLRATFESELVLPRNAGRDDDDDDDDNTRGEQEVEKGSRIPGLPMHSIKAGVSLRVFEPLEVGLSMLGQSSQPFRGDEANLSPFVHGYVILNAQASYRLLNELSLFVRAQNLLNTHYDTFGVLANPAEVLPGASDPRFLGPGAPLGVWAGMVFTQL